MLGCKSVRAHLSASHDDEIPGWYGSYVRFHSSICPPCKRTRKSLEHTIGLLRRLKDEPPIDDPPDAPGAARPDAPPDGPSDGA